jgi:exodeoxyribonuclease VII small subunit
VSGGFPTSIDALLLPIGGCLNINDIDRCNHKFYAFPGGRTGLQLGQEFSLPKFEECLQRLEKIVQELEKGDAPLEKSLTLFEEGMQLSSACRKELEQAEGKVEILLKQNGKLQAVAFEPESEKSSALR